MDQDLVGSHVVRFERQALGYCRIPSIDIDAYSRVFELLEESEGVPVHVAVGLAHFGECALLLGFLEMMRKWY